MALAEDLVIFKGLMDFSDTTELFGKKKDIGRGNRQVTRRDLIHDSHTRRRSTKVLLEHFVGLNGLPYASGCLCTGQKVAGTSDCRSQLVGRTRNITDVYMEALFTEDRRQIE